MAYSTVGGTKYNIVSEVTDMSNNNEIYHSGVKGMKWGVRKARSGYIQPRATLSRRDQKEQSFIDDPQKVYNSVYKRASSKLRKGTRLLNNSQKYKGKNFKTDSPLRQEYYNDYSKMVEQQLNAAAISRVHIFTNRRLGMSPHRTLQMKFSFDYNKELRASYDIAKADTKKGIKEERKTAKDNTKGGGAISIALDKARKIVKHEDINIDDTEMDEITIDVITDDAGYIVDINYPEEESEQDSMEQSALVLDDAFIAHYGRLGMRWGQRRFHNKYGEINPAGRKKTKELESEHDRLSKSSTLTKKGAQRLSDISKEYEQLTGKAIGARRSALEIKKIQDMSDEELQSNTIRKQLETQYQNSQPKSENSTSLPVNKKIQDMSNEELQAYNARKQLETTYLSYQPKPRVSLGKRFIVNMASKVIAPVAIDFSKAFIKSKLSAYVPAGTAKAAEETVKKAAKALA